MTQVPEGAIATLERIARVPHVMTIGNFDGVHRGHQYLIQRVIDAAVARGSRSLVVTFEPHPTAVLRPDVPFHRLASPERKLEILNAAGVDDIAVIPFDREFAALEPEEFLELLARTVQPVAVFVGSGFRFGKGRAGDGGMIEAFGQTHGFETTVVERLQDGDVTISSSSIRDALSRGNIARATASLGRRYRLRGTVEHGAARGRELGFPTANLLLPADACVPADGIYAGYAHLSDRALGPRAAMIYIGTRPTFDNGDRQVEVNILDFSGDLYTLDLEIEFVAWVRGDQAFDSAEALAAQMQDDEATSRAILASNQPEPANPD
ncbi:MAG TPA: bifunctional riboflavin kinase/FAD synthetase [Thermomicrobiales bacterium]|nr:bifunctional riboflavin kinase/FAD synthetase [Thermomicrobiales bacterium]